MDFGRAEQEKPHYDRLDKVSAWKKSDYKKYDYSQFECDRIDIPRFNLEHFEPDRFDVVFLRRGVIGISKVGYT